MTADYVAPEIEEVRVLRLQPGDVIIARVANDTTAETAMGVRQNLEGAFPGYRVIVTAGIGIEVARPDQSDGDAR